MFNVLIFIIGAGIMFYMCLRSVLQRRRLQQKGQRVEARVAGTVQSRDGAAYLLEFETEGGSHRLHYPKAAKGKGFAQRRNGHAVLRPRRSRKDVCGGRPLRSGGRDPLFLSGHCAAGTDGQL